MFAGTHSAEYMGIVALFGPIPKPRKNLAMNKCHHVEAKACQMHVALDSMHVRKIVPRLPRNLFIGSVNQHPRTAQHK